MAEMYEKNTNSTRSEILADVDRWFLFGADESKIIFRMQSIHAMEKNQAIIFLRNEGF